MQCINCFLWLPKWWLKLFVANFLFLLACVVFFSLVTLAGMEFKNLSLPFLWKCGGWRASLHSEFPSRAQHTRIYCYSAMSWHDGEMEIPCLSRSQITEPDKSLTSPKWHQIQTYAVYRIGVRFEQRCWIVLERSLMCTQNDIVIVL